MVDQDIKHAGDLFTLCRRQYGLTPEEVLGILGLPDVEALKEDADGDYVMAQGIVHRRLNLESGRVLRPEAGVGVLEEELALAEQRAWENLRKYRFQEFGHWAEVWATLSRIIGKRRPNPFAAVIAAMGKRGD